MGKPLSTRRFSSMPHIIRLHAVWSVCRPGTDDLRRIQLPDTLHHGLEAGGVVEYRRSFNCPTGLEDGHRVVLVIHHWVGILSAFLDDRPVVASQQANANTGQLRIDITDRLSGSHRLVIRILSDDGAASGLDGIVTLEID